MVVFRKRIQLVAALLGATSVNAVRTYDYEQGNTATQVLQDINQGRENMIHTKDSTYGNAGVQGQKAGVVGKNFRTSAGVEGQKQAPQANDKQAPQANDVPQGVPQGFSEEIQQQIRQVKAQME